MPSEMELTSNSSKQVGVNQSRRRRRWWLLILFGIAAVLISLGVTAFSTDRSTQFAFLKSAELVNDSEAILNTVIGTQRVHYQALYMSDRNLGSLKEVANKELAALKWTPTTAGKQSAGWRNAAHDTNLIMFAEGTRTRVWIIKSRPPTALDRVRLWLKARLPFLSPKAKPETPP